MTEIEDRRDRRNLMLCLFWICVSAAFLVVVPEIGSSAGESGKMKFQIRADGQIATATLLDTAAARDFALLLPPIAYADGLCRNRKNKRSAKSIATDGAPAGEQPAAGDIAYYSPWGNLAIFHQRFRYSARLVKLGHIDEGLQVLARSGPIKVTIEPLP
jgi:hypothetical protein